LVLLNGGTPGKRLIFPISRSPESFDSDIAKNGLKEAPKEAVAIIKSLQPQPAGETHPLALLSKLHNIDKHRKLNVIAAVARDTELVWSRPADAGGMEVALASIFGNEELRDGAVLPVGVRFNSPDFPGIRERFAKMKVQGYAAMFIAFEDSTLLDPQMAAIEERHDLEAELGPFKVDWILQEILQFVGDKVFPALEPFFD
jgi:hypothetical protein